MKAVVDRIVQYANRYQLTNVETGEVIGTFDFEEVTGTVQQVGTEIDKELFDSIANDLAARVKLSGGELAGTIVTFSDISGTAENVASGDTSATLWGKVKNWFSRLKALAFKNKVAAGDFEAGAIKDADVAADAAIAQGKVSGLMTDYVASISVSGRTVTYKNKNGATMGTATTQDTTYGLASQSGNGLMSADDKTKLDGIESGAQKNAVLGVKGGSESAYRTGNVNITKANIGLGNVDNTSDADKPISTATQTALNGKANTSGAYPNMTVGKATNADNATNATNAANATKATQDANGNVIDETYATKTELVEATGTKVKVNGTTQPEVNFTSDPQTQINDKQNQIDNIESGVTKVGSAAQADKLSTARNLKVDLASGNQQPFDGSADATEIGVKGILPVGNGGTGTTSLDNIVVRTDSEQSLSVEQKRQFQLNVGSSTQIASPPTQIGWYNIATIPSQSLATLEISERFWNKSGGTCFAFLSLDHYYPNISTIASGGDRAFTKIRTRLIGEIYYIDIYNNTATASNSCRISMTAYPAVNTDTIITPQTPTFVGVDDNPAGASNIEIVDINAPVDEEGGRMSTSGTIYSNGSPVLVGSAPTWVTGSSGSLTLPSAGWYIFKAGSGTTGIVYWDETMVPYRYVITNELGNTYILVTRGGNISASGGGSSPNVSYYKLA